MATEQDEYRMGKKNLGGIVGVRLIKELNGEPCVQMKDPLKTKK